MTPKIAFLMLTCGILAACGGNTHSRHYDYQDRNNRPYSPPPATTQPYVNAVATHNEHVTGIFSRVPAQVDDYIKYRLDGYADDIAPDTYGDVAALALWMISDDVTDAARQARFNQDTALANAAMFVLNRSLKTCAGTDGATMAQCFADWRLQKADVFKMAAADLRANATLLNLGDAVFMAPDDHRLKFTLDDTGKITGVTLSHGDTDQTYSQQYDSSAFIHLGSDEKWGPFLDRLDYNSTARARDMGLTYADFGTYQRVIQNADGGVSVQTLPFAGGYAAHEIAPDKIETDMQFAGHANAVVTSTRGSGPRTLTTDGAATLTFDPIKNQTKLIATLNDWYDVTATQTSGNTTIVFEDQPQNLADDMKLFAVPDADGKITTTGAQMNMVYYGPNPDNHTPTEAAGLLHFTDCGATTCGATDPTVTFNMSFGGRRLGSKD
ncbi:hypothetical protein HDR63_00230 [bacterium]|nr:hypothetical protein [bacterium]